MERRITKLIVGYAGGTAGKNAKTYKLSLPSTWVNQLSLEGEAVEIAFDGEHIVIASHLKNKDFVKKKSLLGHRLVKIEFFDADKICSEIIADFSDKSLSVENRTENIIKTAFGKNVTPSWKDFKEFMEERCVPRGRAGIREYLETIGAECFDPFDIVRKTSGRMAEDNQWIKWEELL